MPGEICPRCSLRLIGPGAERLRWVDSSLWELQEERVRLVDSLRRPAPEELRTARTGGAESTAEGGGWRQSSPVTGQRSGQQLLLGLGALLVVVAALVFVAVAWQAIGVGGQVGIIVAVTLGVGAGAHLATRRGLAQTGEALAWLTGALFVVDASAARSLGLVPADLDGFAYLAGAAVVGMVCLAAAGAASRVVTTFGVLAVVFAQVPLLAVLGAVGASVEVAGFALVGQAWADAGALHLLGGRIRRTAAIAALVALGAAVPIALGLSAADAGARPWFGVALGLICASTAVIFGMARRELRAFAVAGGVLAGVELAVAAGVAGGITGATALAVVAAASLAPTYLWWCKVPGPRSLAVLAVAASAYVSAFAGLADGGHSGSLMVAIGSFALAATAAASAGRRQEAYAPAALSWWATLAAATAWLEMADGPAGIVLSLGAAGLLGAAWRAPLLREELVTLVGAAVAGIVAVCLLCRRHHRRLHRPGWSAVLRSDAELVVTDPGGRLFTSHPPGKHPRPPPEMFAA